uniref:Uncharacterized protein n=1 Tax=Avena sativa TaxID=4498 RepID=A0ACD5VP28_AVESA
MRGARRRGGRWSVAAWLFFLSHMLLLVMSRGGQERLVRAEDGSRRPPVDASMRRGGEEQQRLSRVGSRPPCCVCRSSCGGCAPCKAVQVRAGVGILRPLCANYEPVRWKCKCGDAVFDP